MLFLCSGSYLAEGARFTPRSAPHTRRLLILRKSIAIIYVEFWYIFLKKIVREDPYKNDFLGYCNSGYGSRMNFILT
jgi:hypothetical protein